MAKGGGIMIQLIKKISLVLIAAGLLIILGGFAAVDFDVLRLSTTSNEDITMKTSEINMDQIDKLVVSASKSDLKITPTKGDKFIITYPESELMQYELNVTKHKIELEKIFKVKLISWFEFPNKSAEITIQVPEAYLGSMDLTCSHGDVEINDITASQLIVDFKYGDIQMNHVSAEQAEFSFDHGTSQFDTLSADSLMINDGYMESEYDNVMINKAINLTSKHGSLKMMNATAKMLNADLRYSSMQLEDSTFTDSNAISYEHDNISLVNSSMNNLSVNGSYGDLELMDNKVDIIVANIKHGDIYGSLQGKKDDYAIAVSTDHGESEVESQKPNAYKYELDITLEYGDADINFTK